jgi:hypothetical protein
MGESVVTFIRPVALALVPVLLSGCGTGKPFTQPNIDQAHAVHILTDNVHDHLFPVGDSRIFFTRIDEENRGLNLSGVAEEAYVTPGVHTIRIQFSQGSWTSSGKLVLDAKEGHVYVAHHEVGQGVRFWFVDATTGKVVGRMADD